MFGVVNFGPFKSSFENDDIEVVVLKLVVPKQVKLCKICTHDLPFSWQKLQVATPSRSVRPRVVVLIADKTSLKGD